MSNTNPIALDFNDLKLYDSKIKSHIKDSINAVVDKLPDFSNYYTKSELAEMFDSLPNPETIDQLIEALHQLEVKTAQHTENLNNHEVDIEKNKSDITRLENAVYNLAENKLDESVLDSLATKDYVASEIAKAEIADKDIDLSNYYTKSETEMFVKAAIADIPDVDLSDYAKKDEIPDISNFITKSELDSMNLVSQDKLSQEYVSKETYEESIVDINEKIDNIEIPDTSNFATKDDLNNLATIEYINNNYISNTEAENFATHSELEEAVTEVVDQHFEETVIVHVDEEIEKKLAENQTINYGTFGEV